MNVFISIIIINAKYHSEDYKVSAVKHYLNNKPINRKKELQKFYKEVSKYKLNKIISLDETSISRR